MLTLSSLARHTGGGDTSAENFCCGGIHTPIVYSLAGDSVLLGVALCRKTATVNENASKVTNSGGLIGVHLALDACRAAGQPVQYFVTWIFWRNDAGDRDKLRIVDCSCVCLEGRIC